MGWSGESSTAAITGSTIVVPCVSEGTNAAVNLEVDSGQIVGCKLKGSVGVDTTGSPGDGVAIGFNRVEAQPGQHFDTVAADEVAHNILKDCVVQGPVLVAPGN